MGRQKLTNPLERMLIHYKINSFKYGTIDKKGFEMYQRVIDKMKDKYDTSKYEKEITLDKHLFRYQLK